MVVVEIDGRFRLHRLIVPRADAFEPFETACAFSDGTTLNRIDGPWRPLVDCRAFDSLIDASPS